jgi:hypothetical protein
MVFWPISNTPGVTNFRSSKAASALPPPLDKLHRPPASPHGVAVRPGFRRAHAVGRRRGPKPPNPDAPRILPPRDKPRRPPTNPHGGAARVSSSEPTPSAADEVRSRRPRTLPTSGRRFLHQTPRYMRPPSPTSNKSPPPLDVGE